ncbi:putative enoyl-CoA hydratase echA8 [Enhygromyxa salina]|uniref:Putative enoyl-CoA hydratase echA8 n=1 Tax=Enhygromyxa salina TaxID=215803 RepID=A0A2S9XXF9_9BACT|nr:crotonase/enoyl-CoA hydratase family protein [Enhygromyxa salina]PRP97558.1 putative enoyl-CoA hydratase echA8 [Enhygromyxa salina]
MSTQDRVTCTIEAGVAEVHLNRPDKHNGLNPAMFDAIVDTGEQLRADPSVRAVILAGEGPSFCAGLDFLAFMAGGEAVQTKLLNWRDDRIGNLAQRLAWVWTEVPAPVIAAVHGACVGGGLQLALAADIRVVHPDAKLAVREIVYGMIPDMSISQTLSRLVRLDVAKELTFTGRDVDGREAAQLGLATRLSEDPLAAARAIAEQIAARSPHAVRAAKQLWNRAPQLGTEAALRLETELQMPLLGSRNQLEAVQARFMKRAPKFEDPT